MDDFRRGSQTWSEMQISNYMLDACGYHDRTTECAEINKTEAFRIDGWTMADDEMLGYATFEMSHNGILFGGETMMDDSHSTVSLDFIISNLPT